MAISDAAGGIEAAPIVRHGETGLAVHLFHSHPDLLGLGVPPDIA
jgi:hypothetical protein